MKHTRYTPLPSEDFVQVLMKSTQDSRRNGKFSQIVDGEYTDDGQHTMTKAHLDELKNHLYDGIKASTHVIKKLFIYYI